MACGVQKSRSWHRLTTFFSGPMRERCWRSHFSHIESYRVSAPQPCESSRRRSHSSRCMSFGMKPCRQYRRHLASISRSAMLASRILWKCDPLFLTIGNSVGSSQDSDDGVYGLIVLTPPQCSPSRPRRLPWSPRPQSSNSRWPSKLV